MNDSIFPDLSLSTWEGTRNTLHGYSRLLGAIRRAASPRLRHWAHVTLLVDPEGLVTTPIPTGHGSFGLRLDLLSHKVRILTSGGQNREVPLEGQSLADFYTATMAALEELDIHPTVDAGLISDNSAGEWDRDAIGRFWRALVQVDLIFKAFKGKQRQETSPVQLFPHHFDLALSWLSGRLVPDQDPEDEDRSDELVTFGFVTGDEAIAEPYFYCTAYPEPAGFVGSPLPEGARWNEGGFSGAVLPYRALVEADQPRELLSEFLRQAHEAGAARMRG